MAKIKKQRIRFICFSLGLLCPAGNLSAQNHLWPTDAGVNPTSSFAGFRCGHFHVEIDSKIRGREGYNVFTTRNGYVRKMRISPFGYGGMIYQMPNTGEMAVYAYL